MKEYLFTINTAACKYAAEFRANNISDGIAIAKWITSTWPAGTSARLYADVHTVIVWSPQQPDGKATHHTSMAVTEWVVE